MMTHNVSISDEVVMNVTAPPVGDLNEMNITTSTSSSSPQSFADVMLTISYVVVGPFLVFGVCGNLLTIIVMRSRSFRHLPVSIVLIALAVSDTVLNLLVPFNKGFVRELLGTDIRSYSDLGCHVFFWMWRTAKMSSSWLVVLISFERLIAVCFPLRVATINTRRNVVSGIVAIYVGIGGYVAVWSALSDRRVGGVCMPNTKPRGLETTVGWMTTVGTSLYVFLPSLFLLAFTAAIIVRLQYAKRMRQQLAQTATVSGGGGGGGSDSTARTTVMLVAVSIAFILLVLPIGLAHLISHILGVPIFESTDVNFVIFREVAQILEQLNYSINFFLYVIVSRSFSRRIPEVLCCRKCGLAAAPSNLRRGQSSRRLKGPRSSSTNTLDTTT